MLFRSYRPSDPMHHINWKASSKGQGLLVNQFDSTTNIQMRMFLDTEDSGIVRHEELTEEGIRIAASLASRIVKEKMELTVTGNGMGCIHLKDGAGNIQVLYQELSHIDINKPVGRICEELEKEKERLQSGAVYVVISMNQDKETAEAVASIAGGGAPVLWVIPVSVSDEVTVGNIRGVRIFRWEMTGV